MSENRYYWGVVLEVLSDWSGHTREELHEAFRQMFLGYEENGIKYAKSTADLTTVEMERYLEDIRTWAALHEIYVPLPGEATTD